MFVCVVPLSEPSIRDLIYPLWDVPYLGLKCKKRIKKKKVGHRQNEGANHFSKNLRFLRFPDFFKRLLTSFFVIKIFFFEILKEFEG